MTFEEEGSEGGVVPLLLQDQLALLFQQYHSLGYSQERQPVQELQRVNMISAQRDERATVPFQSFGF